MKTMTPFERFARAPIDRPERISPTELNDACEAAECPVCGDPGVNTRRQVDHAGQTLKIRIWCYECDETYAADIDARSTLVEAGDG